MPLFGRKNKDEGLTLAQVQALELENEIKTVDDVRRQMSVGEHLEFGGPTRCPNCGMLGFVESVNRTKGNSFNFCYTCRNRWVITSRAVKISLTRPVDGPEPATPAVMSNPWSMDGFIELEDDLSLEISPALEAMTLPRVHQPVPQESSPQTV